MNDNNDDDDALLTAAVPVIVDDEAAYYPLPPPLSTNIDEAPQFLLLLPRGGGIRYHEVLPTDTFQGVCLRYRVTPTELWRANKMLMMRGSSDFLKLAPEVLVIPPNGSKNSNAQLPDDAHVGRGRFPTKEEKIATLVHGASCVATTKDELLYS